MFDKAGFLDSFSLGPPWNEVPSSAFPDAAGHGKIFHNETHEGHEARKAILLAGCPSQGFLTESKNGHTL
jgi:hypothetical protein